MTFSEKISNKYEIKAEQPSASKLAAIQDLKQSIHNLKNKFPMGIKSIDDANDDKLKRLHALLKEIEDALKKDQ